MRGDERGKSAELVQPHLGQRDTDLRHVDIVSPGEVASGIGPRQLTELFQGLDDDFLGIWGEWLSSYMKDGMEGT